MSQDALPVSGRSIELRFLAILTATALGIAAAGFFLAYRIAIDARSVQLGELARAQARLMESVAIYDAFFLSGDLAGAGRAATLSQIRESHHRYAGFGDTGEVVLAERQADEIVFLLPTRKRDFEIPKPASVDSDIGEPMRLALEGGSGVVIGNDHSGEPVLAAYEWLPFLEIGLVCKVDMAEIRAPFVRAGLLTGALALVLILTGAALSRQMVSPLVARLFQYAERIRDRDERYRALVGNIPGAVFRADATARRTLHEVSEPIQEITGYPASAFLRRDGKAYSDLVVPEDTEVIERALEEYVHPGQTFRLEYRIRRADGEIRWISEWGTVAEDEQHRPVLEGVLVDVTERKVAEQALAELPRKLSRYLSPEIYRTIFESDEDVGLESSRKKLTVFFSDIVGFTARSDVLDPEDLSFIINTYLNRMADITIEHGGTLDKFIGDGILTFFGDPETKGIQEDALACIRMAVAMQDAVAALNEEIRQHGIDSPIEIRMGVSTGYCTVGNFGSESQMDYTAFGRNVNLASRLENAAPAGGILIARETWLLVQDAFECEALEPIEVKGFDQPIDIFLVSGARERSG